MSGRPYQRCSCRDPETRKPLGRRCPKLKAKRHALGWFYRYDAPRGPGGTRRQPEVGPFPTEKAAAEDQAVTLARLAGGGHVQDRQLRVGKFLADYVAGKLDLRPSSQAAIREAVNLYWIPALGHLRLVELRDYHVSEAIRAMMAINQDAPDHKPSEVLRRLLAARADDERRDLPAGERRHKKSTKPLSPARIRRVFAVLHAALETAVPQKIAVNPCDGVILPRARKVRPLPWTAEREAAFREALRRQMASLAAASGALTAADRQRAWADPAIRPCPVMVWLPAHTGRFLDYLDDSSERLAALFALVAYCGLRRAEALGLHWADVDLEGGVLYVRESADTTVKSDAGTRAVPLPSPVVAYLRAWRKVQAADQLAWGADWADTGLVFTREDGAAVPGQWLSTRFSTLSYRAGLPPIRFHDLRHGAASLAKAGGADTKVISALLGHSRSAFTADTYIHLFPEVASAAAEAAASVVPRRQARGNEA